MIINVVIISGLSHQPRVSRTRQMDTERAGNDYPDNRGKERREEVNIVFTE